MKWHFNDLLNLNIESSWFIKEAVRDIHFLYLSLILQENDEINNEGLEKYVSTRLLSKTEGNRVHLLKDGQYQMRGEKYKGERAEISTELVDWIESVQKRIEMRI